MNAKELFDLIGYGKHASVKVDNKNSREFRAMVTEANMNGDCIINVGGGYYRPDRNNPEERAEAEHYFASEFHRAREIQNKCYAMKKAFENNYEQISFF